MGKQYIFLPLNTNIWMSIRILHHLFVIYDIPHRRLHELVPALFDTLDGVGDGDIRGEAHPLDLPAVVRISSDCSELVRKIPRDAQFCDAI